MGGESLPATERLLGPNQFAANALHAHRDVNA